MVLAVTAVLLLLFVRAQLAPTAAPASSSSQSSTSRRQQSDTQVAEAATQSATVKTKQQKIKAALTSYLRSVTSDGTASVTFFNLAPTADSAAANSGSAAVYARGKLAVSSNGATTVTSASTYKLFIAAYLFHLDRIGAFTWTASDKSGFEDMIVNSGNTYPEEILAKYGEATIDAWLKTQGWGAVFTTNAAASTTSDDLANLLEQLAAGKGPFSDPANRAWLLKLMGEQIYRTGIPAAAAATTSGATVQDKVGFLNDVNNDAGIVTLPNGQRYVLVIMTSGHDQTQLDFSRINTIAAKVQQIVYG